MKIACWNVAGIRGCFKKGALDWLQAGMFDIICFQETKATREEAEKVLSNWITEKYQYRYWNSCTGEFQSMGFQRKGFSGTSIWSKQPGTQLEVPEFDKEGRTTAVEFSKFIIVTVYTPNGQTPKSSRFTYRVNEWDNDFRNYILELNKVKPTIICGDFNVAHDDKDVYNPDEFRNKVACFTDIERSNLDELLANNYIDAFRIFHPNEENQFTYWTQTFPYLRKTNRGWRIDYFFIPTNLYNDITDCSILPDIKGSDHCPITLSFDIKQKRVVKIRRNIKLRIVDELSNTTLVLPKYVNTKNNKN